METIDAPSLFSWRQMAFAGLLIAGGWAFGYARSHRAQVQNVQDWVFSKLWSAMSEQSAERVEEFRKPLWLQAHGNVLEIGIGHGEGLMLLPHSQADDEAPKVQGITNYVAIEPNAFLHAKLVENAAKAGFTVNYDPETCPDAAPSAATDAELPTLTIVNGTLDGGPDAIPAHVLEHAPYDCILVSMVFCSVNDLRANLQAIQHLLKPGGKYLFIEHVRHTDTADTTVNAHYVPGSMNLFGWKMLQSILTPIWKPLTGNCHMNRDTGGVIRAMDGWSKVEITTHRGVENPLAKLMPLVYGMAVKQ
ncbi:hypothetical protein IW147_005226 [Coemansia sp. RSA 720]|nr:hypothetical protein IW147_005226 [Coemansia sp. RSA 720]